jgi:hypothetical protein
MPTASSTENSLSVSEPQPLNDLPSSSSEPDSIEAIAHRHPLPNMQLLLVWCLGSFLAVAIIGLLLWFQAFLTPVRYFRHSSTFNVSPKDLATLSLRKGGPTIPSLLMKNAKIALKALWSRFRAFILPVLALANPRLLPRSILLLWMTLAQYLPAVLADSPASTTATTPSVLERITSVRLSEESCSSHLTESVILRYFLLGVVFITLINIAMNRPRIVLLLICFLVQLPTALALTERRLQTGVVRMTEARSATGLTPGAQLVAGYILMLWLFVLFSFFYWALLLFLALLIPTLPVAVAIKFFGVICFKTQEPTSKWATASLVLPFIVCFWASCHKPENFQVHFSSFVLTLLLAIVQIILAGGQSLQSFWLLFVINTVILLIHFAIGLHNVVETIETPISHLRRAINPLFDAAEKVKPSERILKAPTTRKQEGYGPGA